jgi:hypothetical protein
MTARAYDLLIRQKWRGRGGTEEYLERQQQAILETYDPSRLQGVRIIATDGLAIDAVVKEVVRAIHFEEYREFDFGKRLAHFRS